MILPELSIIQRETTNKVTNQYIQQLIQQLELIIDLKELQQNQSLLTQLFIISVGHLRVRNEEFRDHALQFLNSIFPLVRAISDEIDQKFIFLIEDLKPDDFDYQTLFMLQDFILGNNFIYSEKLAESIYQKLLLVQSVDGISLQTKAEFELHLTTLLLFTAQKNYFNFTQKCVTELIDSLSKVNAVSPYISINVLQHFQRHQLLTTENIKQIFDSIQLNHKLYHKQNYYFAVVKQTDRQLDNVTQIEFFQIINGDYQFLYLYRLYQLFLNLAFEEKQKIIRKAAIAMQFMNQRTDTFCALMLLEYLRTDTHQQVVELMYNSLGKQLVDIFKIANSPEFLTSYRAFNDSNALNSIVSTYQFSDVMLLSFGNTQHLYALVSLQLFEKMSNPAWQLGVKFDHQYVASILEAQISKNCSFHILEIVIVISFDLVIIDECFQRVFLKIASIQQLLLTDNLSYDHTTFPFLHEKFLFYLKYLKALKEFQFWEEVTLSFQFIVDFCQADLSHRCKAEILTNIRFFFYEDGISSIQQLFMFMIMQHPGFFREAARSQIRYCRSYSQYIIIQRTFAQIDYDILLSNGDFGSILKSVYELVFKNESDVTIDFDIIQRVVQYFNVSYAQQCLILLNYLIPFLKTSTRLVPIQSLFDLVIAVFNCVSVVEIKDVLLIMISHQQLVDQLTQEMQTSLVELIDNIEEVCAELFLRTQFVKVQQQLIPKIDNWAELVPISHCYFEKLYTDSDEVFSKFV